MRSVAILKLTGRNEGEPRKTLGEAIYAVFADQALEDIEKLHAQVRARLSVQQIQGLLDAAILTAKELGQGHLDRAKQARAVLHSTVLHPTLNYTLNGLDMHPTGFYPNFRGTSEVQRSQAASSDSRASLPAPGPLTGAAAIRGAHPRADQPSIGGRRAGVRFAGLVDLPM